MSDSDSDSNSHSATTYGAAGRIGVGVPQGNPTVEPEMRRLLPDNVEPYTVRLTSPSDNPRQRLLDYLQNMPEYAARYATLQVDSFVFACTASSYLLPEPAHSEAVARAEDALQAPLILAADAITAWLQQHKAKRIALLSPYPEWLNEAAVTYWEGRGFEVLNVARVDIGSNDTYAIYDQQSDNAAAAAARLADVEADAFVITGTGMPTLPTIATLRAAGRTITSSANALADAALARLGVPARPHEQWGV